MIRAEAGSNAKSIVGSDENAKVILAADDKHFFFEVLMDELQNKGLDVVFADNAKVAWQYIKNDNSAVIVVDYALSGYQDLCKEH